MMTETLQSWISIGDEVYLCADVTDIADGATATIKIVEKDADFPSDPNCHVRKNLLDANTMSDNDYISQDEYKRRKDQR